MKVISSPETILIPADARPWPAEDLPFPPQLLNVLRRIGVARLGQIHATPYADLREVRGCGTAAMGTNRERWATPDELARALRDRAGD